MVVFEAYKGSMPACSPRPPHGRFMADQLLRRDSQGAMMRCVPRRTDSSRHEATLWQHSKHTKAACLRAFETITRALHGRHKSLAATEDIPTFAASVALMMTALPAEQGSMSLVSKQAATAACVSMCSALGFGPGNTIVSCASESVGCAQLVRLIRR